MIEPAWSRYAARLKATSVVRAAIVANPMMFGRVASELVCALSVDTVRDPDIRELLEAAAQELQAADSGA